MIDWYRMPWRKSLVVPLMISMSHSTSKITAGNIIKLSISSFGGASILVAFEEYPRYKYCEPKFLL